MIDQHLGPLPENFTDEDLDERAKHLEACWSCTNEVDDLTAKLDKLLLRRRILP